MTEVLNRLDTLLGGIPHNNLYGNRPTFDEEMFDRMFEFITSLEPEQLSESQAGEVVDMIEDIELEYELDEDEDELYEDDELDEDELDEVAIKRVRRNKSLQRKRRRIYRKHKAKRRMAAKRYRRSSRGKMMAKKAKRMARRGRTATGRRKRRYMN